MPSIAKYKHHGTGLRLGPLRFRPRLSIKLGPCKTCGRPMTASRRAHMKKQFCRLKCLLESRKFLKKIWRENIPITEDIKKKLPAGCRLPATAQCKQCKKDFYHKPNGPKRKFCRKSCYRLYFAERFDRWIESPQTMSLPQNYDEFLTQDKLRCVVDGCDFEGHNLALHVNRVHGLGRADFKRAMGFNQNSGIVSLPLKQVLEKINGPRLKKLEFAARVWRVAKFEAQLEGDAAKWIASGAPKDEVDSKKRSARDRFAKENDVDGVSAEHVRAFLHHNDGIGGRSLEEKEHHVKSSFAKRVEQGRTKCVVCGDRLLWVTSKSYCSEKCRNKKYNTVAGDKRKPMDCARCGMSFRSTPRQRRRAEAGLPSYCSRRCRWPLETYKTKTTCSNCRTDFPGSVQQKKRSKAGRPVFCSSECIAARNFKSVLSIERK